jgi:competence protein ComEC
VRPLVALHRRRAALAKRLIGAGRGGGLLAALAVGDRRALGEDTRAAFRRLGLSHLLAVSGLHLAMVSGLTFAAARAIAVRSVAVAARWDARVVALAPAVLAAVLYALLSGWGVPVRRALVFLLAVALAVARGRPGLRGQPLAAAAMGVLAFEPQALFSPGAQLSFAASAALASAAPSSAPLPIGGRARLRRALSDGLGASASAVAATAPLTALHWGRVAPLGLVANLLAIPWTAFALLPAALGAALVAELPFAAPAEIVLGLSEGLARLTLHGVEAAASVFPWTDLAAQVDRRWLVPVGVLVWLALRVRGSLARTMLAVGVSVALAVTPVGEFSPPAPRMIALEVGQGSATVVQGREAAVLIDAGTAIPGGPDLGLRVVVRALAALGIGRLDRVLVTHADLDHRGGIPAVLAAVPVGAVWIPHGGGTEAAFRAVVEAARVRGVPVFERGAGSPAARVGDLRLTPLWPPRGGARGPRNDRSLVVRVDVGGRRLLFCGDIGGRAEAVLAAHPSALRAEVLDLPHHGSRTSGTASFLRAVGASVAVASAPLAGRFGMPHPELLQRARAAHLSVWWTGRDGAVLIGLGRPLAVWSLTERAPFHP